MGFIFTILGVYTSYRLWGDHTGLAIFAIIATLYQASSLNEMFKENLVLNQKTGGKQLLICLVLF